MVKKSNVQKSKKKNNIDDNIIRVSMRLNSFSLSLFLTMLKWNKETLLKYTNYGRNVYTCINQKGIE